MANAVLKLDNQTLPALYAVNVVSRQVADSNRLFELFGWESLPFELKNLIAGDLAGYRDELLGLYSTRDQGVLRRRNSVSYWVKMYMNGDCSLETACTALQPSC